MTTTGGSEIKRQKGGRPIYRATVERDGRWWLVTVPGLSAVRANARRLEDAAEEIRLAIALTLEVPEGSFDVTIEGPMRVATARVIE